MHTHNTCRKLWKTYNRMLFILFLKKGTRCILVCIFAWFDLDLRQTSKFTYQTYRNLRKTYTNLLFILFLKRVRRPFLVAFAAYFDLDLRKTYAHIKPVENYGKRTTGGFLYFSKKGYKVHCVLCFYVFACFLCFYVL